MKTLKNMNKTTRIAIQRFLELLIPTVFLSVIYSLLLQYKIIKTVLPGGRGSLLMYYTPMLFAIIYAAFNAIRMRQSRKHFIMLSKHSGSLANTAEKDKTDPDHEETRLTDDPKGYYIANYSALAAFAILPFISRYAFDTIVFRWIFGIMNWLRLAVIGMDIQSLNKVPVYISIAVFVLILAAMIPLAQINVRKNYIKNLKKKQEARNERLSTATKATAEQREKGTNEKIDIYSVAVRKQRKLSDKEKAKAEEARRLREKGRTEKLDIYSKAAGNQHVLSDEEKAKEEESRRLREKGRTEKLDIYSMAADKDRELSDEEKAREEESRRLREKGRQGPQRVDIYNIKKSQ